MKNYKRLDDQEITKASGGSWGSNKYPKETYHAAGFITMWTIKPAYEDRFLLRIDYTEEVIFFETEANKYVDFYLSNSREEYLKYIQKTFPVCKTLLQGYDALC